MVTNTPTSPLHITMPLSSHRPAVMSSRWERIGILRIAFGLIWGIDAWLKWQPAFQNTFVDQVSAAKDGQPALIQQWISFWSAFVSVNPLLFARLEASTETALAIFLVFGVFSNLTSVVGMFLSLGIWAVPEGFGGPYVPGHSTDVGTALPYAMLFALLLMTSAGRYYGLDSWLTPRLGRLGFLAAGVFGQSDRRRQ
jgi:thiosulfate dehydrogenase (quinone) large subunit